SFCPLRKGTWACLALRAWITSPRASRDLLMFWASFSRSPCAPDFQTRSEPARSTRFSFPGAPETQEKGLGRCGTCMAQVWVCQDGARCGAPQVCARSCWCRTWSGSSSPATGSEASPEPKGVRKAGC
uniref:Uncharacterized protein n=1 Tax=Pelusios castaneus TaxID=367368 RepID=A0A8C8RFC1_9SAUR